MTLYQKNADEPRQVASTLKIVTALIVAENDLLDQSIRIEREDTQVKPTRIGIRAVESYPRRQLLQAMMIHSVNDCAAALAQSYSGSLSAFARVMHELAER